MSEFSTWRFIADQRSTLPEVPTDLDCAGKTIIVTGANTGLGLECAKHFVRLSPARVIVASRSMKNGEAAIAEIERETGKKGIAEVWTLDLSSYDSIKAFATKAQSLERLDILVENAGVALQKVTISEGLETTITVNVAGTLLLGALLLPKLKETAEKTGSHTHLSFVGSDRALTVPGILEKVDGDILETLTTSTSMGDMISRYPVSKLLLLYAVREFASRNPVSSTGVVINFVNPGLCYSSLSRDANIIVKIMIALMRAALARTTEVGSRTLVFAAVAGEDSHGKYLSECVTKENYVPEWVKGSSGQQIQKRVWDSLAKQLNATQPGCI